MILIIIIIIIPYLLVYKSTPPFLRSKIGFFIILVREVKFRQIEISQKVNLLFLGIYWKHGVLKNCRAKCNRVLWSLSTLVYITTIQERVHESTRQSCYMPSHRFQWNFASLKGLPQNSKRQTGFCFGFFPGGDRPTPPVFPGFHQGNRFK